MKISFYFEWNHPPLLFGHLIFGILAFRLEIKGNTFPHFRLAGSDFVCIFVGGILMSWAAAAADLQLFYSRQNWAYICASHNWRADISCPMSIKSDLCFCGFGICGCPFQPKETESERDRESERVRATTKNVETKTKKNSSDKSGATRH